MNCLKLFIALVFTAFAVQSNAQENYPSEKYPHVTSDLISDNDLHMSLRHQIGFPGVWGLGLNATYLKPKLAYGHAEAGYGWVIADHKTNATEVFKNKKWRPWVDVAVGYPVFTFTRGVKARYTTEQGSKVVNGKIVQTESFYKIKVPTQTSFVACVGYRMNPYSSKIYPLSNTNSKTPYSAMAHNFTAGLRIISFSNSKIAIKDSKTSKIVTGETMRQGEIYFGVVLPAKDFIDPHESFQKIYKSEITGLEFMFRIPYRHNSYATFDIGIRAFAFGANSSSSGVGEKGSAQLVIGNSIFGN